MPRLSYGAPGVYVEEVPSARQPIAGVGTNTVAFIGLVPDRIYCPVPNEEYNPVAARVKLTIEGRMPAGQTTDQANKEREQTIQNLNAELPRLRAAVERRQKKLDEAGDPAPEDLVAARDAAQARVEDAERLLAQFTAAAPAAPAPAPAPRPAARPAPEAAPAGGPPQVEAEMDTYRRDEAPAPELLTQSQARPYYLVPFDVKDAPLDAKLCTNFTEYTNRFGNFSAFDDPAPDPAVPGNVRSRPLYPGHHYLTHAVKAFFDNGGTRAFIVRVANEGDLERALAELESIDEVSIIAAPGLPKNRAVWEQLQTYCEDPDHQNVFAILDSKSVVNDGESNDLDMNKLITDGDWLPRRSSYAAFYFPEVEVVDPAKRMQDEDAARQVAPKYRGRTYVPPSGHMAGVYARIDEERGVHKAPANAVVRGALEVKYYISKPKQDLLNPRGVNCIRIMNGTVVVWGARTIGGDQNGEWKYVNVRRFAGFLQESIDEGTQWVVFEPNDPSLWGRIRLNVSLFLLNCWRSGALFGTSPEEAFYVKCDAELNPPEVRDVGQVIIEIGVAIVRPAEFVIFRIAQFTGQRG
jgi:uncharacterized protein